MLLYIFIHFISGRNHHGTLEVGEVKSFLKDWAKLSGKTIELQKVSCKGTLGV